MSTSLPINSAAITPVVISGMLDLSSSETVLTLGTGEVIRLPTAVLLPHLSREIPPTQAGSSPDVLVIPIVEEQIDIQKREIVTGTVRLQKIVQERDVIVDELLASTTYSIERIPVGLEVAAHPEVRQEGETTIYSVVEEIAVVHKALILREEVRVTRHMTETHLPQTYTVRVEDLLVERSEPSLES